MAEVLVEFDTVLPGPAGGSYTPRACARVGDAGLWEGWIEFVELESGSVIRTSRETTQPTRQDVHYWATGLSHVYLQGALDRALSPTRMGPAPPVVSVPAFDGPAPPVLTESTVIARPLLDPFEVYAQGEDILRRELSALDVDHLRTIIRAYALDGGVAATSPLPTVLVEYIVAEVRSRRERLRESLLANGDADNDRVIR